MSCTRPAPASVEEPTVRVIFDPDPPPPAPTWQLCLFGELPESAAEQGTLFDVGKPERKPAARPDDPAQREMFP